LTDVGSMFYYGEESMEQFGVICGDQYFETYPLGVMLISSINLVFETKQEKNDFMLMRKGYTDDSKGLTKDIHSYAKNLPNKVLKQRNQNFTGKLQISAI